MASRSSWPDVRDRRMREPGAAEAYQATKLAYELGRTVRALREQRGWSQTELARAAGMTQPAVARFESGGTVPTLPVLERLAHALEAELIVQMNPRTEVA
ncbi:MAG: helix-turn-helix domain-containing protein [Mycobacteriales bacterium]